MTLDEIVYGPSRAIVPKSRTNDLDSIVDSVLGSSPKVEPKREAVQQRVVQPSVAESTVPADTVDLFAKPKPFDPLGFGTTQQTGLGIPYQDAGDVGFSAGGGYRAPSYGRGDVTEFVEESPVPVNEFIQAARAGSVRDQIPSQAAEIPVERPKAAKGGLAQIVDSVLGARDQRADLAATMLSRGEEIANLQAERAKRGMDTKGAFDALSSEDRNALLYYEENQRNGAAAAHLSSTASALIPGGQLLKDPIQKENETAHPIAAGVGNVVGMMGQTVAAGGAIKEGLKQIPALASSPLLLNIASRVATGAGVTAGQAIGRSDVATAVGDVMQSAGGGAVSIIPELLIPKHPAAQLILQPATDLIYDAVTDAARGRDVLSKEWLFEEMVNLGLSLGFAVQDVRSGKQFTIESEAARAEISSLFQKGGKFKLVEPGKVEGVKVTGDDLVESATSAPKEAALGWKPPIEQVQNALSPKVPEKIVEAEASRERGDTSFDPEKLEAESKEHAKKSGENRVKAAAIDDFYHRKSEAEREDEITDFASSVRREVYQTLGGKSNAQWQRVAGFANYRKNGEQISFDPATQKVLDQKAESWNEAEREGISPLPKHIVERYRTNDQWTADDVAAVVSSGMNGGAYKRWQSGAESRRKKWDAEEESVLNQNWHEVDNGEPYDGPFFNKGEFASTRNADAEAPKGEQAKESEGIGYVPPDGEEFRHTEDKARTHNRMKMPELVEITKGILGGKLPKLQDIVAGNPAARGAFYDKGENSKIELRRDLFANPEQAEKTLAHEIGHADDWKASGGEVTPEVESVANRIAAIKGDKNDFMKSHINGEDPMKPEEVDFLRREIEETFAVQAVQKVEREIVERGDVTAEQIRGILGASTEDMRAKFPELYDYLARLDGPEKKAVVVNAMKGMIPDHLKGLGEIISRRMETVTVPLDDASREKLVMEEFVKQMDAVARNRDLVRKADITEEMKRWTAKWRPWQRGQSAAFDAYRDSPQEMYADAISGLLTEPDMLMREAPTFWKAYHGHLEMRPEMKAAYQDMVGDYDAIMDRRSENIRAGFDSGDAARKKALEDREATKSARSILTGIKRELIDKNAPIIDAIKKGGKDVKKTRYALEELDSQLSEVSWYVEQNGAVYENLKKNGLSWDDLGEIMFEERVIHERTDIANPRGWTPEVAAEQRERLKTRLGSEKFAVLEEQLQQIRETRTHLVKKLEEAGMFSEELQTYMNENPHYATYAVVKHLENRAAGGVLEGVKIHHQKGTLSDIDNPATATLLKDMALLREANRTIALRQAMGDLVEVGAAVKVTPVRLADGGYRDPKPQNSEKEIVSFLQNGKTQFYEVDAHVAKVFDRSPKEYSAVVKGFRAINNVIKQAYVQKNPGFWVTNLIRDFRGSAKRLPGMGAGWELLPRYIRAVSDTKLRELMLDEMKRQKMLIVSTSNHGLNDDTTAIEETLGRFMPELVTKKDQNAVLTFLQKIGSAMDSANEYVEQTSKIAGKLYLDEKTNMNEADKAHFVRTQVGSPDYNRRGSLNDVTNTFGMFYNARKEGWRADIEAFKRNPGEFAAKSAIEMVPTMIAIAAGAGVFGEEFKKIYDKVGSYHKRSFDIVPLGETAQGKAVVLRIPRSETAQVIGSLVYTMAEQDATVAKKLAGVFTVGKDQIPSLAPALGLVKDASTFATGNNVFDEHMGKMAVDENLWDASGLEGEKAKAAGKYLWNSYGGAVLHRFETDDIREIESQLEKITGMPIVGNPIGRLLLVTDGGEREESWEIRKKEEGEKNAERWVMQKRIVEDVNGKSSFNRQDARKLYDQLKQEGVLTDRTFGSFKEAYHKIAARKSSNSEVLEILGAGSRNQRDQIIENILDRSGKTGSAREEYKRSLKRQAKQMEAL